MRRYALFGVLASLTLAAASACSSDYEGAEADDAGGDATPVLGPDGSKPVSEGGSGTEAGDSDAAKGDASKVGTDAGYPDADATTDADAGTADATPPCAPGFEPGTAADGGCVVGNPFKDPSFTATPPNAWTTARGALLLPTASGVLGPGLAEIANDAVQPPRYRGSVTQTTSIPSTPEADPFAFRIAVSYLNSAFDAFMLGLYVDGVALFDPLLGRSIKTTTPTLYSFDICLGERSYGAGHAFMLGSTAFVDSVSLEEVGLVRDPSCPRPGVVVNGDFESGNGFTYPDVVKAFSVTGGTSNSRAAGLAIRSSSTESILQPLSIPNRTTAALSFRTYGKGNVRVLIDGRSIARRRVDAAHDAHVVCLPRWVHGIVAEVSIASGQSTFADASEAADAFFVDDVALIDSAACADGALADNGGFEQPSVPGGDEIPGWSSSVTQGYAITRKTLQPHGGSASLSMKAAATACATTGYGSESRVSHVVTLPTVSPSLGGGALRFWYRYTPSGNSAATLRSDELSSLDIQPAAGWTSALRCLHINQPGTRVGVEFRLSGPTGAVCAGDAELEIDDASVVNDVSCPTD